MNHPARHRLLPETLRHRVERAVVAVGSHWASAVHTPNTRVCTARAEAEAMKQKNVRRPGAASGNLAYSAISS
jgi:hypothetical protein